MNKVNISSMRVLQMLQLLFDKNYTMNELAEELSRITGESCSNFLICKYINTCRYCGIDIQKIDNKYTLLKLPFGIDLSDDELTLIDTISRYYSKMRISKTIRGFNSLLSKLNQRSNKYYHKIDVPEDDKNIEAFEQALIRGRKIELVYIENDKTVSITCDPMKLSEEGSELVFTINFNSDRKKIYYSEVKEINITSLKSSCALTTSSVIFKLKSALAKRYTLRPDEKVVEVYDDGSICVLNRTEDKASLLNRLMKYGALCEVKSPRSYRKEIISTIEAALANYK